MMFPFEAGTFLLLSTEATAWAASSGAQAGDTIVILGTGRCGEFDAANFARI